MRTMPRSSRLRSDSSERLGMSRVISSSPSLVVRASTSYSSMWIEVSSSSDDQPLGEDDGVLEVVALPGHERDEQVLAQRHLAHVGGGAVGEDVPVRDLGADIHDRLLVDERALVGAHELLELVLLLAAVRAVNDDLLGVDVGDGAGRAGHGHVAGVDRRAALHTGADQWRIGHEQRHGLGLHVGAHQRPVGVIVLQERDHRRRDRPDLLGGDVDQIDLLGRDGHVLTGLRPAQDLVAGEVAALIDRRVRLRDDLLLLLRGVDPHDVVGHPAVLDDPVRGGDEAVLGDLRVGGQRADQADVRALGGLDRAHPAVVGGMHIADLDRGALTGQATGAQRR